MLFGSSELTAKLIGININVDHTNYQPEFDVNNIDPRLLKISNNLRIQFSKKFKRLTIPEVEPEPKTLQWNLLECLAQLKCASETIEIKTTDTNEGFLLQSKAIKKIYDILNVYYSSGVLNDAFKISDKFSELYNSELENFNLCTIQDLCRNLPNVKLLSETDPNFKNEYLSTETAEILLEWFSAFVRARALRYKNCEQNIELLNTAQLEVYIDQVVCMLEIFIFISDVRNHVEFNDVIDRQLKMKLSEAGRKWYEFDTGVLREVFNKR